MRERDDRESSSRTFDALFESTSHAVLAYAIRRTASINDAEDAVAETFVVAWRRASDMPSQPLPWLYGIARRILANQRRATDRRNRLNVRLWLQPRRSEQVLRTEGGPATEALAHLRDGDQELLRLVAWEELDHAAIAEVLGISVNAVAIRLHRARQRFAEQLDLHSSNEVKGSDPVRTSDQVTDRMAGRDHREDAG